MPQAREDDVGDVQYLLMLLREANGEGKRGDLRISTTLRTAVNFVPHSGNLNFVAKIRSGNLSHRVDDLRSYMAEGRAKGDERPKRLNLYSDPRPRKYEVDGFGCRSIFV
jgi:hypothetical protein